MLLTQEDIQSLVDVKQRSPHQLIGLHPLPDGSGLVAHAFLPDAVKVQIQPAQEKDKPASKLTRLHKAGVFEGTTTATTRSMLTSW